MSWAVNLANTGEAAKWMPYPAEQNAAIEAAHVKQSKSMMLNDDYKIDFGKKRQVRRDDANRWREIRRVDAAAKADDDAPAAAAAAAKPTKKRGAAAAVAADEPAPAATVPASAAMEDEPAPAAAAAAPKANKRAKATPAAAAADAAPVEVKTSKRGKAAAATAAEPAAAPAAREKRVRRRKRADDDEEEEADAEEKKSAAANDAEDDDAPAATGRASKRARPSREKKEARSASPAVADDADDAEDAEEDGEADEAPKAKSAVQLALDGFTPKAVGWMFKAAGLPLPLSLSILDSLTVQEIALWTVPVCKQWYATAVESAAAVQAIAKKNAMEGSKAAPAAPAAKRGAAAASSSSAAAAVSSLAAPGSSRSDPVIATGKSLPLLCASRLRGLVTSLKTKAHVFHGVHHSALDVKAVTTLSEALPWLRELQLNISSTSVTPVFQFPAHLRELSVLIESKVAPPKQRLKKTLTAPAKGWTADKTEAFTMTVVTQLAKLKALRVLAFGSGHQYGSNAAKAWPGWIEPFAALPHLHTLALIGGAASLLTLYGGPGSPGAYWITPKLRETAVDLTNETIAVLRKFPALTNIPYCGQGQGAVAALLPALLAPGHPFKLTELPLAEATITADLRKPLETLKPWLTSLAPARWHLKDVSWVAAFKSCTKLLFDPSPAPPNPSHFGAPAAAPGPPPEVPSVDAVVDLLEKMPWVTDLSIRYEDLTDQHLARILAALPKLQTLQVRSKAVTSLAAFTARKSAHLASTLQSLAIHTSAVPRDDSVHLLSLVSLRSLDIAGSFSEPLFAKQLQPFQPPFPKEPLHWLRKFTPRSAAEAIPTPIVTLEAKEAAFADFEARILAGDVCSAELLNSSQLSVTMQFLTVHDFCAAARTCRAWRAAASLPSAWPPVERTQLVYELKGSSAEKNERNQNRLQHWNAIASPSKFLHAKSRCLKLADSQPQCSTSILPHLHIMKHARSLELQMQSHYGWNQAPSAELTEQYEKPLLAVAALARLESFSANFSAFPNLPAVNRLMQAIGAKLRRASLHHLPTAAYAFIPAIEVLSLSCDALRPVKAGESTTPGAELAVLHRLKSLSIQANGWNADLPETLRALSADHALRELNITHEGSRQHYWNQSADAPAPVTLSFMPFMRALTGALCGAPVRNTGDSSSSSSSAAAAASSVMGLDEDERLPASSPSTPALLEILRIRSDAQPEGGNAAPAGGAAPARGSFPLEPTLRISTLRVLELTAPAMVVDLSPLETVPNLPPLECLGLTMYVVQSSYVCLRLLKGLKQLRISDSNAASRMLEHAYHHHRAVPVAPPPKGAMGPICRALQELELLDLSVQIERGELDALGSLQNLHTLRLASQPNLLIDDFAFLPRLPHLSVLFLDGIQNVPLQRQGWMVEREGVEEEAIEEVLAHRTAARGPGAQDEAGGRHVQLPLPEEEKGAEAAAAAGGDAHMADAPAAAAAASASSDIEVFAAALAAAAAAADALPSGARLAIRGFYPSREGTTDILTLVGRCAALTSFSWSSTLTVLKAQEGYTARHTTYKCKGRVSMEEQRRRDIKERVRERHALRGLIRKRNEAIAAAEAEATAKVTASLMIDDDGVAASRSSLPPPLSVYNRAPQTSQWGPSEGRMHVRVAGRAVRSQWSQWSLTVCGLCMCLCVVEWVALCLLPNDPSEVDRATAAAAARKAREPAVVGRAARWRPSPPLAPPNELAAADQLIMDEEKKVEEEGRVAEAEREAEREAAREAAKLNPKKKGKKKY